MPQSPNLGLWCAECTGQASSITRRWKNSKSSLFLSFSEMSTGIRAKPPEYWACTEAPWFAAFESCTSTIALSAMPNAVRRMALAHRGRTETWDDSLGNESVRSLLSRLPQNLKEEICHHRPGSSRSYAPRRTSALKASLISACSSQLRVSLSCTKRR